MEAKLAAYRAQKAQNRKKVETQKKVWSLLTFEGKLLKVSHQGLTYCLFYFNMILLLKVNKILLL